MTVWLFTCRHTFESTLCAELVRSGLARDDVRPLLPGLVRAASPDLGDATVEALRRWDPTYALQVLPAAVEIRGASIRELAGAAVELVAPQLATVETPWGLHGIVPGMLKGNPRPPLARRAGLVVEAFAADLRQRYRRVARRRVAVSQSGVDRERDLTGGRDSQSGADPEPELEGGWNSRSGADRESPPPHLVQLLLLDPETLWCSHSPLLPLPPHASWPSSLPAGLADVADDPQAPASSFRKLAEAFACLGVQPRPGDTAVDLGASPGGWTRVLRRFGAHVTAVDRAPLAPALMADRAVRFEAGDAFRYRPANRVEWVVSDIIAYPERVLELVDTWCGQHLARHAVLQMKFKGEPEWQALDAALSAARRHGYHARARHFFNDKNEVTLLLTELAAP